MELSLSRNASPVLKRHGSQSGITLLEVLAALVVMGVGLLAILVIFPLGALSMAQAIKDDRTAAAAVNASDLSEAGKELLSETAKFVETSVLKGSADSDTATRLREKYEDLVHQAADMEAQLEELRLVFPPSQIQRYLGPLLAQVRFIKQRLVLMGRLLSLFEDPKV